MTQQSDINYANHDDDIAGKESTKLVHWALLLIGIDDHLAS